MSINPSDLVTAIEAGKGKDVIAQLKQVTSQPKVPSDAFRMLAYAYFVTGQSVAGMLSLAQSRRTHDDPEADLAFGRFLRGKSQFKGALDCFSAYLKEREGDVDAMALVTMTHHDLGDYDQMVQTGQACIAAADADARSTGIEPLKPKTKRTFDPKNRKANIVAYSLFGDNPYYRDCAIAAASQVLALYPSWSARFYCANTVPQETVERLRKFGAQVALVEDDGGDNRGLFWRFLPFDDPSVSHVLVRDVDSPITLRETEAVARWIASGYPFHAMRDHPNHLEPLMAGMWGGQTGHLPNMSELIDAFRTENETRFVDQHFLRRAIWSRICDMTLSHDRYYTVGDTERLAPPDDGAHHIGFGLGR